MPSFADSIFLFLLALLLFGPKKLPVLARELGKWMGEFRRASNEFKMQMEDELRASEQAERQKQIAAMEAAAPVPPPLGEPAEPEHPHMRSSTAAYEHSGEPAAAVESQAVLAGPAEPAAEISSPAGDETRPVPIATSGTLNMMPPATGLPTPRSGRALPEEQEALSGFVAAIPETSSPDAHAATAETLSHQEAAHGD